MQIGLAVGNMREDREGTKREMVSLIVESSSRNVDLLCFGEFFLQGYDSLSWDFDKDKNIALHRYLVSNRVKRMYEIPELQRIDHEPDISFGYIEKTFGETEDEERRTDNRLKEILNCTESGLVFNSLEESGESICSSNLIVDSKGRIIDNFRRITDEWTKGMTEDERYRTIEGVHSFYYKDKVLGVVSSEGLFCERALDKIKLLDLDVLLWPLYLDLTEEDWELKKDDYIRRTEDLDCTVFMVNSCPGKKTERVEGGAYIVKKGEILCQLDPGKTGVISYEI